jgi:hypothetical protein
LIKLSLCSLGLIACPLQRQFHIAPFLFILQRNLLAGFIRTGFTAGYGAENPHTMRAMSASDSQNFVTLVLKDFARGHDRFSLGVILCHTGLSGKKTTDPNWTVLRFQHLQRLEQSEAASPSARSWRANSGYNS